MALQYSGTGYDESLREVAAYFHYPRWERGLDYGFINPSVAPLIYSRPLYPLLALLPVKVFGVGGIYVPGIGAGLLSCAAILATCRRRGTALAGALVVIMLLASRLFTEIGFGIYIDALVLTGASALLLFLPWRARPTVWHVVATCSIAALMLLARQVPLLTIGTVAGGWLWAAVATRRIRNDWLPHFVGVTVTTVVVYAAVSRWAPYDPLPFLRTYADVESRGDLVRAMPGLVGDGLVEAGRSVLAADRVLVPFFLLFLVGLWSARRTPLAGVAVGVFVSCLATLALNNLGYLRYLTPLIPVAAVLAADALATIGRLLPERLRPGRHDDRVSRPRRARVRPAALALVGAVVAALVATVVVSQPASLDGAPHRKVHAVKGKPWPLSVRRGTLVCAGNDLEVWFVTPRGVRYALSGTAMAASWRAPRISSIARGEVTYGWPALSPLLGQGVGLCRRKMDADAREHESARSPVIR